MTTLLTHSFGVLNSLKFMAGLKDKIKITGEEKNTRESVIVMSKEAYCFEGESGQVAFLSGVVDTLSDIYLDDACPQYDTVEVDLFAIDERRDFNSAIKSRLEKYLPSVGGDTEKLRTKINQLDIAFEKQDGYEDFQAAEFVVSCLKQLSDYRHGNRQQDAVSRFFENVEYYLGKPVGFYKAVEGSSVLEKFYIGILFNIAFIEYDGFLLMLCFGTSE